MVSTALECIGSVSSDMAFCPVQGLQELVVPGSATEATEVYEAIACCKPARFIQPAGSADVALLSGLPILRSLGKEAVKELRASMDECTFKAGDIISDAHTQNDKFHVITSGSVEFLIADGQGGDMLVDETSGGGFFGELSLLAKEKCCIKVRAKDDVRTLALNKKEFEDFVERNPRASIELMHELAERLTHTDILLRQSVSQDVNKLASSQRTFGQRIADKFAATIGSWPFIIAQSTALAAWVVLNATGAIKPWDPYPFILLNLVLSFQAAYAGPIIMMSHNRAAEKDRLAAKVDHQVNVKNEMSIAQIAKRLENLEVLYRS